MSDREPKPPGPLGPPGPIRKEPSSPPAGLPPLPSLHALPAPPPIDDDDERGEGEKKKKKKDKKKGIGTDRGIETMFRTSYHVHIDMSSLADNKANIMVTVNALILSITLASISPKIDANPWLLLPTIALLGTALGSLIFAVRAARPRVTTTPLSLEDVRQNRKNILFFGNFVHLREDEYITGMTELVQDHDRLYHNMMRDIYSLGQVLQQKFALLRISYTIFMIGLGISVISFIAVLFGVVVLAGGTVNPT